MGLSQSSNFYTATQPIVTQPIVTQPIVKQQIVKQQIVKQQIVKQPICTNIANLTDKDDRISDSEVQLILASIFVSFTCEE